MTAALIAADTPPPPDDGPPPGQPYVSPDDLSSIPPLFEAAAQQALLPLVAQIWTESAGKVHAQLVDAADLPNLPPVSSLAAETYLAQAANTFAQVGDDLWNTARSELLAGFQAGESIPQLSDRLRASAGLTARKATLVARTQVLDASNAGSYATAQASGLELHKGWLDTPDARTRPTHRAAGALYGSDEGMIPLADQFTVGGYSCDRPHDPSLPIGERASCRCALIYSMGPSAVRTAQDEAAPVAPLPNTSGQPELPVLPVAATPAEAAAAQATKISEQVGSPPVTRQLAHQATLTPRAMTDLDSVHIPALGSPDGDAYLAAKNGAAHAYYTPLGSHPSVYATAQAATDNPLPAIWFNPHWNGNRMGAAVRKGLDSGWYSPTSVNPLERTLAHEYGHHVTNVLFEAPDFTGTAAMPGAVAERILGPINDALGANRLSPFARNGDLLEPVHWGVDQFSVHGNLLDEWVRQNKDLIAANVSRYATKDFGEFLAEVWQEYSTMGARARPHIQTIGVLLRDVTEELRAGGLRTARMGETAQLAIERPLLTPAEFEARATRALQGRPARERPPVQAEIDAHGSDSDTWKATGFSGLARPVPGGTSAVTNYLRRPGFANDRLRFPAGRPRAAYEPELSAEQIAKYETAADRQIAALDKLMAQSKLDTDTIVWRGARLDDIPLPDDPVGFEWIDNGFVSTSGVRSTAEHDFAQGSSSILMRILAPDGTPALGFRGLGESELLLDRGLMFRVVAEHERLKLPPSFATGERRPGARFVDVEIVPRPTPAAAVSPDLTNQSVVQLRALAKERGIVGYSKLTKPQLVERLSGAPPAAVAEAVEVPLASRRITELRTLAKQRGLTVPARATKADLIKALEAPPKTTVERAVEANAAQRAAARERNKLIESRAAAEQTLAELDDLLFKKASREVFEQRIALAQLDAKDLAALRAALDDPAKLRAQVTRISKKQGITVDGKAGAKVKFDPATMDPVGEVPAPGTPMVVIRRGSTITVDGDTILLNKAVVKLPTAPVKKAVKAAPKKKATAAAIRRRGALQVERADAVRAVGEAVAELDRLLFNEASERSLLAKARSYRSRKLLADDQFERVNSAITAGDRNLIHRILDELLVQAGGRFIGRAGSHVLFDPERHQPLVSGERFTRGQRVEIYRPGIEWTDPEDGKVLVLERAVIDRMT